MSTAAQAPQGRERVHPITWFATRAHEVLDGLGEAPAWAMSAEDQRQALVELARLQARIGEMRLRVLAAGDRNDIGAECAATSTAAWLADRTRVTHAAARADVRLAESLDGEHQTTRAALADGAVNEDQARVIVAAVRALPDRVSTADRVRAEQHLVGAAADHDAQALQVLGRRVFEVLDPEAADAYEGEQLAAEERAAQRKTFLGLREAGDGTCTGRFKIPALHGQMLRRYLQALTAPRRNQPGKDGLGGIPAGSRVGANGEKLTSPELLGLGFCQFLERFPAGRLGKAGGVNASVVVLIELDKLLSGLGTARLDTGLRISATEALRLACEAGIIPAVLGGKSQVLHLGRRRRFHNKAQRIAMMIRDGGCTTEGCDRPQAWCHAHHETPWEEGGVTSVDNGRLLCPYHHGKAHDRLYDMTRLPNGKVRFHRRT
jgi:hypothetical protein